MKITRKMTVLMIVVVLGCSIGCSKIRDSLGISMVNDNVIKTAQAVRSVSRDVLTLKGDMTDVKSRLSAVEKKSDTLKKQVEDVDTKYATHIDLNNPSGALYQLVQQLQTAPPRGGVTSPSAGGLPAGEPTSNGCLNATAVETQLNEVATLIETVDAFRSRVCRTAPAPCNHSTQVMNVEAVEENLAQLKQSLAELLAKLDALGGLIVPSLREMKNVLTNLNQEFTALKQRPPEDPTVPQRIQRLEYRVAALNQWAADMVEYERSKNFVPRYSHQRIAPPDSLPVSRTACQ